MDFDTVIKSKPLDRSIDEDRVLFKKYFNIDENIHYARAPGRINIIGEHVDYCGYSVFPMAIENDIFMIFSTAPIGSKLSLRNKNDIYEQYDTDLATNDIQIDNKCPRWYNYFLCGYKGVIDYAINNDLKPEKKSLFVLVNGNIPPNAGLSSSSALVVCSAMVTMMSAGLRITAKTLAKICASCERFIGTQGGGMDQCISILAEPGSAMVIDFGTPEITNECIYLPSDSVFVVTNSREQMNKAATSQFNERVVESRLAAKLLLKLIQPETDVRKFRRLSDVQNFLQFDYQMMSKKIDELINEKYSRETLLDLLEMSDIEFANDILSQNTLEKNEFCVKKRAKHVIDEVSRVMEFKRICLGNDGDLNKSIRLGELMNESQNSLKNLYECSSTTLDELVDICRKAGSYGSRLTGAGWGGCVISLVAKDNVDRFLGFLSENFYKMPLTDITNEMFVTKPSDGAAFLY